MLKIFYSINCLDREAIHPATMTLREFCVEHGIPTNQQITAGNMVQNDLDQPLSKFAGADSTVSIYVSTKEKNA